MKFGRNQINKAGKIILSAREGKEYDSAMQKINEWRTLHLPALETLQVEVTSLLKSKGITFSLVSKRLKRISSIIYKLDLNPEMGLGGMQDIGGLRIVLDDINILKTVHSILLNNIPKSFDLIKVMDYVLYPKDSGYRSIHFMYKYKSTESDSNDARVELQIRTKLQHSWAMAVETAGLITSTSLKSSMGDDEWLNFFKLVSSLFAIKERQPILKNHSNNSYDMHTLMRMLFQTNYTHKQIDTLKALKVTVDHAENEEFRNGYYILNIDFVNKRVKIHAFSKDEEYEASIEYSNLEKSIKDSDNAVVLVSVPKIKELKDAYPSYFLNTDDFISVLETMIDNCRKLKLNDRK